jgi:hypothetical protein
MGFRWARLAEWLLLLVHTTAGTTCRSEHVRGPQYLHYCGTTLLSVRWSAWVLSRRHSVLYLLY